MCVCVYVCLRVAELSVCPRKCHSLTSFIVIIIQLRFSLPEHHFSHRGKQQERSGPDLLRSLKAATTSIGHKKDCAHVVFAYLLRLQMKTGAKMAAVALFKWWFCTRYWFPQGRNWVTASEHDGSHARAVVFDACVESGQLGHRRCIWPDG